VQLHGLLGLMLHWGLLFALRLVQVVFDAQVESLLVAEDITSQEGTDEGGQDVAGSVLRSPVRLISTNLIHVCRVLPNDL